MEKVRKDVLMILDDGNTRCFLTDKNIKEKIGSINAFKTIRKANNLKVDNHTIKLRKYDKIEIWLK